jgi:hypothetical protein
LAGGGLAEDYPQTIDDAAVLGVAAGGDPDEPLAVGARHILHWHRQNGADMANPSIGWCSRLAPS